MVGQVAVEVAGACQEGELLLEDDGALPEPVVGVGESLLEFGTLGVQARETGTDPAGVEVRVGGEVEKALLLPV
ncbi:MAG: hypothetical protein QG622_382, partial [Actinomycetota bacterium]|nr:hypothetical protein [Actinomycetota bacterium]